MGLEETARHRLFNLSSAVQGRKLKIAVILGGIEEVMEAHSETSAEALKSIEEVVLDVGKLSELEQMEQEVWNLLVQQHGQPTRQKRASDWAYWVRQVLSKVGSIRKECLVRKLRVPVLVPVLTPAAVDPALPRGTGHLERVKLPQFSGRPEEYAEFKSQFKQLCGGERYPAIIELTQLRQKIPKEAAAALTGLTRPDQAWECLDELYGNREAAILTAVQRLRGFRSTKSQPCNQIVEVVRAVQRCKTILESPGCSPRVAL